MVSALFFVIIEALAALILTKCAGLFTCECSVIDGEAEAVDILRRNTIARVNIVSFFAHSDFVTFFVTFFISNLDESNVCHGAGAADGALTALKQTGDVVALAILSILPASGLNEAAAVLVTFLAFCLIVFKEAQTLIIILRGFAGIKGILDKEFLLRWRRWRENKACTAFFLLLTVRFILIRVRHIDCAVALVISTFT